MALTGDAFALCASLSAILRQGPRVTEVRVYEPLAMAGEIAPEQTAQAEAYAAELARFSRLWNFAGRRRHTSRGTAEDRSAVGAVPGASSGAGCASRPARIGSRSTLWRRK